MRASKLVASCTILLLVVALAGCPTTNDVSVPHLVGLTRPNAEYAITYAGLVVGLTTETYSDTVPAGYVVDQSPEGGAWLTRGSGVNFTISIGTAPAEYVQVPDLAALTQSAAETAIVDAMLSVGTIAQAYSNSVPIGLVMGQAPSAGSWVDRTSHVDFTISQGTAPPEYVRVPDLTAMPQSAAASALAGAQLAVGDVSHSHSDTVPVGHVIRQSPVAGAFVILGGEVALVVSDGPEPVTVPEVTGMSRTSAEAAIANALLALGSVADIYSDTVPSGFVIGQDPAGGASVARGSKVDLSVSQGPAPVTVPDVRGLARSAAESAIAGAALLVANVSQSYSNVVPAGFVIGQNPAGGASVARGSEVDLTVSQGPAPVTVPDVRGLARSGAESTIVDAGLSLGVVSQAYSDTVPAGQVMNQNPVGGAIVTRGSSVDFTVSQGPAPVIVPNITGETQGAAEQALVGAALTVGVVSQSYSDSVPAGWVVSQEPAGGASIFPGTSVDFVVSLGPAPVTIPAVKGMTQADAESTIVGAGLTVGDVAQSYSNTVPIGQVISQNPEAGVSVPRSSAIDLVVSLGTEGPGVFRVNKATPAGPTVQDGRSWETAYADLQPAIDAASLAGGGEVWVVAGVYDEPRESYPHGNDGDRDWNTASVVLRPGVRVYGGFTGVETTVDERDWETNKTVIDGSKALDGEMSARHVILGSDNATLDGFTVTGGTARNSDERSYGGGLYNAYASPAVANCIFEGNSAAGFGGGMYNAYSLPLVTDCVFEENSALEVGAGMFNTYSSPEVTNCTFYSNSADLFGGGLYNDNSSPIVTTCLFEANAAHSGAGIYSEANSAPVVSDCVFRANASTVYGGGLYAGYNVSLTVTNCVVVGNAAWYGGGIEVAEGGVSTVTNCTFFGNAASVSGDASHTTGGSELYLRNCIVRGTDLSVVTDNASFTFAQYSAVQGGYSGEGNIGVDPAFVDAANGDFRLMAGSPCIDAGTPTDAPEEDIRGVTRPQGAGVDMGAYEITEDEVLP